MYVQLTVTAKWRVSLICNIEVGIWLGNSFFQVLLCLKLSFPNRYLIPSGFIVSNYEQFHLLSAVLYFYTNKENVHSFN